MGDWFDWLHCLEYHMSSGNQDSVSADAHSQLVDWVIGVDKP